MRRFRFRTINARLLLATTCAVLGFFAARWVEAEFGTSHAPYARIARVEQGWEAVNAADGSFALQLPKDWDFVDYTSPDISKIRAQESAVLRTKQSTPGFTEMQVENGQRLYACPSRARGDGGPLVNVAATAFPEGVNWEHLEGFEAAQGTLMHSQILAAYPFNGGFVVESISRVVPEQPRHVWTYCAQQGAGSVELSIATSEPPTAGFRRTAETILSTSQFRG